MQRAEREAVKQLIGCSLAIAVIFGGGLLAINAAAEREQAELARQIKPTEYTGLPAIVQMGEPEVVTEPVSPAYTEEELETLALIIYQEAGADSCSDLTRLRVGTVFVNRVDSPQYPDTFKEVATQYGQYGRLHWTGLEWPERASLPQEAHAVKRAYDIAERVLNGERALPDDVIYQSEHIQGTEIVAESDGFYFCR